MDQKKVSALVLIDLSKAFDSISHEHLLKNWKSLVRLHQPVVSQLLVW